MEHVVVKTISGFLNTKGGTLFIGIDDEGNVLGIESDYLTFGKKQNRDGFLLHFDQVFNKYLGKEFNQYVSSKIESINGKDVCIVEVSESAVPAFVQNNGKQEFYIRTAASTQSMGIKEALEYITLHWNNK